MAIRDVVTSGFGNGTFSGTIALVTTRGYSIGAAIIPDYGPGDTLPPNSLQMELRLSRAEFTLAPNRMEFELRKNS